MPDTKKATLNRIEKTSPMVAQMNRGLAVQWINRDLTNRAHFSIDRDIILYDEDKVFAAMLPAILGPVLTDEVQHAMHSLGVRAYSVGIV